MSIDEGKTQLQDIVRAPVCPVALVAPTFRRMAHMTYYTLELGRRTATCLCLNQRSTLGESDFMARNPRNNRVEKRVMYFIEGGG